MRRISIAPPVVCPTTSANVRTTPAQLVDAVAALQQVTPQGSGIRIDALDEYLKLVCGFEHDAARVSPAFRTQTLALLDHLGVRNHASASAAPLSPPQIHLLAFLYFSICGRAAFSSDGAFDETGFTTFVAQRLALSPVAVASMLASSPETASSPYASLQLAAGALGDQLQVGDDAESHFYAPPISFADIPPDALKGVYLRRLQLTDTPLRGLDLEGADLRDARFADCRFSDLHFRQTAMNGACFERCEFENCMIEQVDIENMRMVQCRIVGSSWSQCNMRHARWCGVALSNMTVQGCHLLGARVLPAVTPAADAPDAASERLSEMCDCRFERCDWDRAVFLRVQMRRSTWRDGTCRQARIINTRWEQCSLSGGPLTDTVIQQGQFDDCTLDGLDASDTIWNSISLRRTSATEVDFSDCMLTALNCVGPCDFTRARFDHSGIERMTASGPVSFTHASFHGSRLSHVLFLGHREHPSVDLSFANFTDGGFDAVTFLRCQMRNTGFASARMQNTVFRGCDLTRSDFRLCGGPDLVSVGSPNQLAGGRFNGMTPSLSAAVIGRLEDHTLRSQLLDPDFADSDDACLTIQIQRFPDFAVRVQLWEILTDQLSTMADDALDDVDPPVLSVLLRPEYASQRALHRYVDSRLLDQLQAFSEHGLPLGRESENDWRRRAVPRLCRLLGTMTNADRLCEFSPLIAFLLTADECAALALSREDRTYLHRAQSLCLPASLSVAFYDVMNCAPFDTPAYRLFITPQTDHAVIVTPDAAPSLLGIVSRPVVPEHSYLYFTRSLRQSVGRSDDHWSNEGNQRPAAAFAPFPRLHASLSERCDTLRALIATYRLPDTLRARMTDGFLQRISHPLIDHEAQRALFEVFDPLCTVTPPYSIDSGITEEAHIIAHLRPTPSHRRDVLAALAPLCPDGDDDALGLCSIAYASLIFGAASASVFGTEYQSPLALRRYGMAWANLGFAALPSLSEAMPQWMRHASGLPSPVTQQELVTRCFGLDDSESHCAAMIARDLAAPLRSPRFGEHRCVPSLRALLGS